MARMHPSAGRASCSSLGLALSLFLASAGCYVGLDEGSMAVADAQASSGAITRGNGSGPETTDEPSGGTGDTGETGDPPGGTDEGPEDDDVGTDTSVHAQLEASRTSCVSPCTVVFSAVETTDEGKSPVEAFSSLGYHFDFDDAGSGNFPTTGRPKNEQVGGPIAAHTFECQSGQCSFRVGVRAQNLAGEHDDAFLTIDVDAPDARFDATDTICVSTSGTFSGDVPCPAGATQLTSVPQPGQYGGRRILLRRGESFGDLCVDYAESNVLIEPFGNAADARPLVAGSIDLGVDGGCGRQTFETAYANARNAGGWISNVTVTGLRVGTVNYGMTYRHLGVHNLDMQFEGSGDESGQIRLTNFTGFCYANAGLSCDAVPFPQGAYVSEVALVGTAGREPGVNIAAFDCPMINWMTVISSTARNAIEHNMRTQGGSRVFVGHTLFTGEHSTEGKQKMTLRGSGITPVNLATQTRGATAYENADPTGQGPLSEYIVVADNTFGAEDSPGNNGWKAGITPQNTSANEGLSMGIFERNRFVDNPAQPTNDLFLAGRDLFAREDNEYSPVSVSNCQDRNDNYSALSSSAAAPVNFKNPADCANPVPPRPDAPGS
ncbi:MAG: hypothetical protein AAGA54_08195 [Myxococcota bacterium]